MLRPQDLQNKRIYFYMGGSLPPETTPNVLAPLVYIHTVKYFDLQTAF